MKSDVFISHASEDKDTFVRPFAEELKNRGLRVWYDEYELKVGDSLRREIDRGLSSCRFGIVVLSHSFFSKEWPQRELDGLSAREAAQGNKLILPVWHGVSSDDVRRFSPILADKVGLPTSHGVQFVADKIIEVIKTSDGNEALKRKDNSLIYNFFGDALKGCPKCGEKLIITANASESGEFAIATCPNCDWEDYYP
jgi:hypothetical protein